MKSMNLNLKSDCNKCTIAKEKKRERLDQEHIDEENNETSADDIDDCDEELDEDEGTRSGDGVKRKRSGENHTHCHCPLFTVSDELSEFISAGQPYRRFKADQVKRRESEKIGQVLLLERRGRDDRRYEMDMRKEIERFKNALKLSEKDNATEQPLVKKSKTPEERQLRKEELEQKRKSVKENLPLLFN